MVWENCTVWADIIIEIQLRKYQFVVECVVFSHQSLVFAGCLQSISSQWINEMEYSFDIGNQTPTSWMDSSDLHRGESQTLTVETKFLKPG